MVFFHYDVDDIVFRLPTRIFSAIKVHILQSSISVGFISVKDNQITYVRDEDKVGGILN